jgi:hypothetical protein
MVGNIVQRYDADKIDNIFWLAVMGAFVFISFVVLIVNKLSQKTKEIKDL